MKCDLWYKVRELERFKKWNVEGTPLGECLYNCNGENTKCKDYKAGKTDYEVIGCEKYGEVEINDCSSLDEITEEEVERRR
jgi:hypothetical protein